MNIAKIIKEHHKMMIEKGFYDCPECEDPVRINEDVYEQIDCKHCKNTGIDPNKNISELLMLIVSELGEALEAHRCGRFTNWDNYNRYFKDISKSSIDRFHMDEGSLLMYRKEVQNLFECQIKDTFEDEIADVFLRLFSVLGYLQIDVEMTVIELSSFKEISVCENIGEFFYFLSKDICKIMREDTYINLNYVNLVLNKIYAFSTHHNIPIEKHINAKMAYNKTRPHKHGKAY